VLAKAHQLAGPIGGFDKLNTIEQELLLRAAELSLSKPRAYEMRVRTNNLIARILRDALRRHTPPGKPGRRGLRDYLAGQSA
jgi:hypothetical protein